MDIIRQKYNQLIAERIKLEIQIELLDSLMSRESNREDNPKLEKLKVNKKRAHTKFYHVDSSYEKGGSHWSEEEDRKLIEFSDICGSLEESDVARFLTEDLERSPSAVMTRLYDLYNKRKIEYVVIKNVSKTVSPLISRSRKKVLTELK